MSIITRVFTLAELELGALIRRIFLTGIKYRRNLLQIEQKKKLNIPRPKERWVCVHIDHREWIVSERMTGHGTMPMTTDHDVLLPLVLYANEKGANLFFSIYRRDG